jgi:hypothetical protein
VGNYKGEGSYGKKWSSGSGPVLETP